MVGKEPFTSDLGLSEKFLGKIDRRMERQNQRMLANLMAWAEILDALGWNVALLLPGRAPLLGERARDWASKLPEGPLGWEAISALLVAIPPARRLVCSPRVQVWADAVPLEGCAALRAALTKREAEVLAWLREGKTGPEISIILGCAHRTVECHVARLYRKLGVRHRTQLLFQTDPRPQ